MTWPGLSGSARRAVGLEFDLQHFRHVVCALPHDVVHNFAERGVISQFFRWTFARHVFEPYLKTRKNGTFGRASGWRIVVYASFLTPVELTRFFFHCLFPATPATEHRQET
jgi:hypothetical protein